MIAVYVTPKQGTQRGAAYMSRTIAIVLLAPWVLGLVNA